MNTDELIDELIRILKDENSQVPDNFFDELEEKKVIKYIDQYPEVVLLPQVYKKIMENIGDKKEVIFSAIEQSRDNGNEEREELATLIFVQNPLEMLSKIEIEKILTPEKINSMKLNSTCIVALMASTGKPEEYLTPEKIKEFGLNSNNVRQLIKNTKKPEEYLTIDKVKEFGLSPYDLRNLIRNAKRPEDYFTVEKRRELGLRSDDIVGLIIETEKIEEYLTVDNIKKFQLSSKNVGDLIIATGRVEEYLTADNIKKFQLSSETVGDLIITTGRVEEYLTIEKIKELGIKGKNVAYILLGVSDIEFSNLIDEEINNNTYNYEKILRISEIFNNLGESNSGKLDRIKKEIAMQVYELPEEKQQSAIEKIKKIYLTTNLPTFAQNFLVFKQLHPNFMDNANNSRYRDRSEGYIPSLSMVNPIKRNHIIFSDLLKIAIESNNRNLRDYLAIIEQGDKMFNLFKEGKLEIDDRLPEESRQKLKKYSDILNALYNQTSKGKRAEEERVNSGDLVKDLEELNNLFSENTNIKRSLPDRIVRMFGYWAGLKNFEQAKELVEKMPNEADKRNRETAEKGIFKIEKGDFAKGVKKTEHFPSMLQNGIVAKEYIGKNADSDLTPLDMDVELVGDNGISLATEYINKNTVGKNLGKILLIIKNDEDYIQTRGDEVVYEENVKKVINDRTKKEYFHNTGVAYGIRTGIGSTNISYIISDKYVDKLGLEIAMNGFYIPIVDEQGQLLFTPEMYDEIRSRMQGLSYYGEDEFRLDETAKNEGTKQIVELIDQNKEVTNQKRQKILQTLNKAIEECGLKMSDKRTLDLLEGVVEVVDTGSTGRGTNEPGGGDFDFMVRLDGSIMKNSEQIKEVINRTISNISKPDEIANVGGNFRYKGVSIEGLKDKIDLDLNFVKKTDEIEYTTEECINDRLETIRRNNPEDYKYVIANILLAKRVLKTEGAYKKKSGPEPKKGKKDIRGGLGAVGIENWVLQNGGSFEKAASDFLKVAKTCNSLSEFQKKYAIWDFGENYMAKENYPHDNFVYNMNEEGYGKMKRALEEYIKAISVEKETIENSGKKGLEEIVQEDMSILNDTTYMLSVENLLASARRTRSYERKYLKSVKTHKNVDGGKK